MEIQFSGDGKFGWSRPLWRKSGYSTPFRYAIERLDVRPPLSIRQAQEVAWFERRYEIIAEGHIDGTMSMEPLSFKFEGECRYCRKSVPHVTFEETSHAFPHMIGNTSLIDLGECDSCNKHFSEMLDVHLGSWTLTLRGAGLVEGKNGVPTLVSPDQKVRIEVDKKTGQRTIRVKHGAKGVHLDQENKTLSLEVNQPSYVPMAVYKSFVKMALAIMPGIEFEKCNELVGWILEKNHTLENLRLKRLPPLMMELIGGPISSKTFTYILLRRKLNSPTDCSYMNFVLQFSNQVAQVVLPVHDEDQVLGGKSITTPLFPHPWSTKTHTQKYGDSRFSTHDLSSSRRTQSTTRKLSWGFDGIIESDLNKPSQEKTDV